MSTYLKNVLDPNRVPQRDPLPGREADMVANHAGGFVFPVDCFTQLRRFLILGSEGPTYYASERTMTLDNVKAVRAAIEQDGLRVVREVVEVSQAGHAPKNGPALFVLALCMAAPDTATRTAAFEALPRVARTGTHLFEWSDYVDAVRGWGKGLRKAVSGWYLDKPESALALQAVKYRQRGGVSHADMLRRCHVQAKNQGKGKATDTRNVILSYMVDGWDVVGPEPHPDEALRIIWAAERAATADEAELVRLISDYRLPMECIPTDKRTAAVYEALIPSAGITWLIRNLGNLGKSGVLAVGRYSALNAVVERLTDTLALKAGRVHPLHVLMALKTYQSGRGVLGKGEWPVVQQIVDALDSVFYLAFKAMEPTGKRWVLGVDVSGSMGTGTIAGMPAITPRVAAAAMSMVTYRTEANCVLMAFTKGFVPMNFGRNARLDAVCSYMAGLGFDRTDCAQPMLWAAQNRVEADVFVVLTDSETWFGNVHPCAALRQYREKMGIAAKLIVAGFTATNFSIADPEDAGSMDVVGFDAAAPELMRAFALGEF